MRRFSLLLPLVMGIVVTGCTPNARTQSEADISSGDQKLSELDEMRKVEDFTGNDYDKMTQVDPNLEQKAMADYDKAIQDDPENAEAYYARGFAELSHGEGTLKAIEDFTKAIELKPDYARAYLMRGRAYEALGEKEKAKTDRDKALEFKPGID